MTGSGWYLLENDTNATPDKAERRMR